MSSYYKCDKQVASIKEICSYLDLILLFCFRSWKIIIHYHENKIHQYKTQKYEYYIKYYIKKNKDI